MGQCFFFQAEDGIRDADVTGVQTCALPIFERDRDVLRGCRIGRLTADPDVMADPELRAPVDETFRWLRGRLAEIIAEGKRTGEYPASMDPEQTAATIAAVLQGGYVLARA